MNQRNNRPTTLRLASATLIALLLAMSLSGCTDTQIADSFSVAEAALTSTAAILQPVNPELATGLGIAGQAVRDANDAWLIYASAPSGDKATAAGKAQVAISAARQKLSAFLADARVKNPETIEYITVYVTVASTVLALIVNHLPAQAQASARVLGGEQSLPVVNVRSAGELKAFFNRGVAQAGHAEAVIR